MLTRRTMLAAGAASLAAPFVVTPSTAQAINIRLQGFLPTTSSPNQAFERMAATLKEKSGGRLNLMLLPVGGAVAAGETLNAMRAGILDGHYSSASFFSATDPAFAVLGDSGASYDTEAQHESFWLEGPGQDLSRELYERFDAIYTGYVYWPSEHIPSRRALRRYEDLSGLKIRVPPGIIADILGRAGAGVVNIPGGEVLNALQSGVIDATDWASPALNAEAGLYRVARFSVNAAHSRGATDVCVARRVWSGLSPELRAMISAEVKTMSDGLRTQLTRDNETALTRIRGEGVEVIEWPRAEIARLRGVTSELQDALGQRAPGARKIVEAHRAHQRRVMPG